MRSPSELSFAEEATAQRCRQIACGTAFFSAAIGLAVLVGWTLQIDVLMRVLPGSVRMKPNTAIGFCLAGLSLFLFFWEPVEPNRWARKLASGLALLVLMIGGLTLWEYATGFNLGIDELIFRDRWSSHTAGRMAPITAFNYFALGPALLCLPFPRRSAWIHLLASLIAFSSLLAIFGYFYGVPALYQSGYFTAVALHTAIAFLILCIGLWCATSHYGFMRLVTGKGTSAVLVRRYGLAVMVLPFLLDAVKYPGEHLGWYAPELGAAFFGMINAATLGALVWYGAKSLRTGEHKEALAWERLQQAHLELEHRVNQRTAELASANANLQAEVLQRARTERANQRILDNTLDVICAFDAEGRFIHVNRASEALWGYSPESLIGHRYMELVYPDDHQDTLAAAAAVMGGQSTMDFENRYVRADGTVAVVVWTASWSEEDQIMFCVARDITGRKQAENELLRAKEAAEEANRAKSEFLANMSHEIRTPMNGIMGMTELVLDTPLEPDQREYLGMAKASADTLLTLINDILDFSKIEAGKLDLEEINFSLRDCIGAMLKPLGVRADQKGLELMADLPMDLPEYLIGDPMRLRQIIINLTDNAIKFTSRGDIMLRVTAETETGGEQVLHFSVADTGIGIPREKQKLIFEAFSQADGSTTRNYGGTGLGLAIASELVRRMDGRIWVESVVGEGTIFHFTARFQIPLSPPPNARSVDPSVLADLRVLVVDDNAVNRRILHEMLKHWRMQPSVVASGSLAITEMLEAARSGMPFPLIILDGMMPEMDGFEVAEIIHENPELSGATVMMLTSGMTAGASARCVELGVAKYLTKPVEQSALLDAILLAVDGRLPAEPKADPALVQAAPSVSLRILLAEDNEVNRALASNILEKRGHRLVLAEDGRQAVEATEREVFDLILMDVQMPEMDGFEATRRIRLAEEESGRHTPIAALTARAMAGDRERCLAAAMDYYLAKPLKRAELLSIIDRVAADRPVVPPTFVNGSRPHDDDVPNHSLEPRVEELPVFSRDILLDQVEGDEAVLEHMIALFQENTPRLLADLHSAIIRQGLGDLSFSAHALLGSLGAFGANGAKQLARQIEEQARTGNYEDVGRTFAALERETTDIHAALAAFTQVGR